MNAENELPTNITETHSTSGKIQNTKEILGWIIFHH